LGASGDQFTADSRIRPWLASGWGWRGRRLSREQKILVQAVRFAEQNAAVDVTVEADEKDTMPTPE
jgi:hypothetical protein